MRMNVAIGLVVVAVLSGGSSARSAPASGAQDPPIQCRVTVPIEGEPPRADLHADPLGYGPWFVNEDRTIWTLAASQWIVRSDGQKIPWVRPKGATLTISGRRLDGDAPPLSAHVPCCYRGTFQAPRIFIPASGCWEVTAKAAASTLTFITYVP